MVLLLLSLFEGPTCSDNDAIIDDFIIVITI